MNHRPYTVNVIEWVTFRAETVFFVTKALRPKYEWTVPLLRRSLAALSPRRSGFDPRADVCGEQDDTGTGWDSSCASTSASPVSLFPSHQCILLIFTLLLLLAQRQVGEAWEPADRRAHFRYVGALDGKCFTMWVRGCSVWRTGWGWRYSWALRV